MRKTLFSGDLYCQLLTYLMRKQSTLVYNTIIYAQILLKFEYTIFFITHYKFTTQQFDYESF